MQKSYIIDVKDKSLGRTASEVAVMLRGKSLPDFQPNIAPKIQVKIKNVDKLKFTGNKFLKKEYKRYSGYPGGLKSIKFSEVYQKTPEKAFKKAVEGMLPKNKLRKKFLENLIFEHEKQNNK